MPNAEHKPLKSNTGWAVLVAFVSYFLLYFVYALGAVAISVLGARYDKSGAWLIISILLFLIVTPLSAYGAMIFTQSRFPIANSEAVFYSFSTGAIILLIANLVAGNENAVVAFLQAALAIAGAWFGSSQPQIPAIL